MDIKNKVIIVTGASAGIGRAVSEALSEAGANVVLVARREDRLHMLAEENGSAARKNGWSWLEIFVSETFAPHVVERTLAEFGRLDVLVNNAGLGHRSLLVDITARRYAHDNRNKFTRSAFYDSSSLETYARTERRSDHQCFVYRWTTAAAQQRVVYSQQSGPLTL